MTGQLVETLVCNPSVEGSKRVTKLSELLLLNNCFP